MSMYTGIHNVLYYIKLLFYYLYTIFSITETSLIRSAQRKALTLPQTSFHSNHLLSQGLANEYRVITWILDSSSYHWLIGYTK